MKRSDPQNGKIICESKRFEEGSKCELKCDPGYIALDVMSTTCLFDETENDFVWDVEDERLQCTPAIGFIIGGIATNYEYINEVDFNSKNGISILICRNQNWRFLFFNEKKDSQFPQQPLMVLQIQAPKTAAYYISPIEIEVF